MKSVGKTVVPRALLAFDLDSPEPWAQWPMAAAVVSGGQSKKVGRNPLNSAPVCEPLPSGFCRKALQSSSTNPPGY